MGSIVSKGLGFIDPTGITGSVLGLDEGSDAGGRAGFFQSQAKQQGIGTLRKQFGETEAALQPFADAGLGGLEAQRQAATPEGFAAILQSLFEGGALDPLLEERTRSVQSGLGAAGLTRSGAGIRELANIPTDLGLQIEQLLSGRQAGLAQQGLGAATTIGQFGQNVAGGVSGLQAGIGRDIGAGIITDTQADAAAQSQAFQGLTSGALAAASLFSDPRLKDNVEEIGEIADLKIYQWDWKPETKGTLVDGCSTIGFMADEVKEKYPHHVGNFGSYDVINYPALLDELEELQLEAA
jgi:hypothetical protein